MIQYRYAEQKRDRRNAVQALARMRVYAVRRQDLRCALECVQATNITSIYDTRSMQTLRRILNAWKKGYTDPRLHARRAALELRMIDFKRELGVAWQAWREAQAGARRDSRNVRNALKALVDLRIRRRKGRFAYLGTYVFPLSLSQRGGGIFHLFFVSLCMYYSPLSCTLSHPPTLITSNITQVPCSLEC